MSCLMHMSAENRVTLSLFWDIWNLNLDCFLGTNFVAREAQFVGSRYECLLKMAI